MVHTAIIVSLIRQKDIDIMRSKEIIRAMQLDPHPEGGYYRETYRSGEMVKTGTGKYRSVCTAIYFLLENEDRSKFHRVSSDELWFFHQGQPLLIVLIVGGKIQTILLGNDLEKGEVPQAIIPANTWFAAKLRHATGYALVSCTVAPGFEFAGFELAKREKLMAEYPELMDIIMEYT